MCLFIWLFFCVSVVLCSVRFVVFIDESGLPVRCQVFVVAALGAVVPSGVSYLFIGRDLVEFVRSRFRVKGEIKFRDAKRVLDVAELRSFVDTILSRFRVGFSVVHVSTDNALEVRLLSIKRALFSLLRSCVDILGSIELLTIVVDEVPLDLRYLRRALISAIRDLYVIPSIEVKMRSSARVPGIQLADVVAGYLRSTYLKRLGKG